MDTKNIKTYIDVVVLTVLLILLTACSPSATDTPPTGPDQDAVDTAVALTLAAQPTNTSVIIPTEAPPEQTATQAATATEHPTATLEPTTTPTLPPAATPVPGDPTEELGEPTWKDTFDNDGNWSLFDTSCFKSEIINGQYRMLGKQAISCWEVTWPQAEDFYLETLVEFTDTCPDDGRAGLFYRSPENNQGYLFGISCDGKYTAISWDGESDTSTRLVPNTAFDHIKTGPGAINRIGITVVDDLHVYYINGEKVTSIKDDTFKSAGLFGFYVRGGSDGKDPQQLLVLFDDLTYWELEPSE